MTIAQSVDSIIFKWTPTKYRTITKGGTLSVSSRYDRLRKKYQIVVTPGSGSPIIFYYDSVTSPVSADAAELVYLIQSYNRMAGDYQKFEASASQTTFTVTEFHLNDNYKVFVNGAYQSFGYTRSGDDVIFTAAFAGGEEVVIMI
uniref:Uncharacterized protein n=1 Tax=viral metagenome TaxID=1070528 RepID=A0A6M3J5D9_9ZZZZ